MRSRLPPHRNPHLSTSDQPGFTHLRAAAATHPSATRDLTNVRVIFPCAAKSINIREVVDAVEPLMKRPS
jgi:hypothetical protein